jgi:hypothetical protein
MRFGTRSLLLLVLGLALSGTAACGPQIDLNQLEATEVTSGYYDFGVVDGLNKLVPSISFRLKNNGTVPADRVALTVSFWQDGKDGELDSKEVRGIGAEDVPPGGLSDVVLVRSAWGYTLQQPRAELFINSEFKDFTAKLFAKRGGKIVPIGQFKIDQRIIYQQPTAVP